VTNSAPSSGAGRILPGSLFRVPFGLPAPRQELHRHPATVPAENLICPGSYSRGGYLDDAFFTARDSVDSLRERSILAETGVPKIGSHWYDD